MIDLGYIGGLAVGRPRARRQRWSAAVLIFRALTYGIQIPLGAFTYLIWRGKKDWRQDVPATPEATSAAAV